MYYYSPLSWWGNDLFVSLFWLVFVLLVILLIIRILFYARYMKGHYGHHTAMGYMLHQHPSPLDIAKERYAKGEITKEQFDQLKSDLK